MSMGKAKKAMARRKMQSANARANAESRLQRKFEEALRKSEIEVDAKAAKAIWDAGLHDHAIPTGTYGQYSANMMVALLMRTCQADPAMDALVRDVRSIMIGHGSFWRPHRDQVLKRGLAWVVESCDAMSALRILAAFPRQDLIERREFD